MRQSEFYLVPLRLGLCNIQFQSADRNPWQNISWKVNSCWTWLCTTSLSPVRSDWPIVQSSFPAKSLFSRYFFKLFHYSLPRQFISRNFSRHVINFACRVSLFTATSMSPCFPRHVEANDWSDIRLDDRILPGNECPIGAPIGLSDSWLIRSTNRKTRFDAILYGHRVVQSHRLAASIAQSSIWDSLWSDRIRLLGLQSPSLKRRATSSNHSSSIKQLHTSLKLQ